MVLTSSSLTNYSLASKLDLQSLVYLGQVKTFDIIRTTVDIFKLSTILSVHNSIENLAKSSKKFHIGLQQSQDDDVTVKFIRDYVEDFLTEHVFNDFYLDLREIKVKKWPHRNPNDLIGLFNAAIDHLIQTCSRQELEQISWPIPELKKLVLDEEIPSYWNDFPYLEQVRGWLKSLKLPIIKKFKVKQV
jgi:hypothetical protein